MIDYHVHTPFCNHAVGSMDEYVRQAIAVGLREICFLDHLTVMQNDEGLSMAPDEVPLYVQAAKILRERYRDRISVRVGLEIDYNPDRLDTIEQVVETFDFDVIACSIHFIEGENIVSRKSAWGRGQGDAASLCRRYLDMLRDMLTCSWFDVIGHLDVMKKFGHPLPDFHDAAIDGLADAIRDAGKAVEVNTSGYNHPIGALYPSPALLRRLCRAGVPVTLGSDAHHPKEVARRFDRAAVEIRSAGYRTVTAFASREPVAVALKPWPPRALKSDIQTEGSKHPCVS